jgi:hypothetical protein
MMATTDTNTAVFGPIGGPLSNIDVNHFVEYGEKGKKRIYGVQASYAVQSGTDVDIITTGRLLIVEASASNFTDDSFINPNPDATEDLKFFGITKVLFQTTVYKQIDIQFPKPIESKQGSKLLVILTPSFKDTDGSDASPGICYASLSVQGEILFEGTEDAPRIYQK